MQYDQVSDLAFCSIRTFVHNSYIHAHIMYQSWLLESDVMHNTNTRMENSGSFLTKYK